MSEINLMDGWIYDFYGVFIVSLTHYDYVFILV